MVTTFFIVNDQTISTPILFSRIFLETFGICLIMNFPVTKTKINIENKCMKENIINNPYKYNEIVEINEKLKKKLYKTIPALL